MSENIPAFLLENNNIILPERKSGRINLSFIDRTIGNIASVLKNGYLGIETSSRQGMLQGIDPRIKIIFMILFIIIVSLKKDILSGLLIFGIIFILAAASRLNLFYFYRRVLFLGFVFGFLIALPASLNIITPGEIILPLFTMQGPSDFWIYHVPAAIGITHEGIMSALVLTGRVVNSIAISFLVLYTTGMTGIIKALKVLRVPDIFLMIITISYKYIFIFAKTIEDIYLSMKSRMAGAGNKREIRLLIAGRMGFMFKKALIACEDVYKAMASRGFSDEVRIYGFERLKPGDWLYGMIFLILGIAVLFI